MAEDLHSCRIVPAGGHHFSSVTTEAPRWSSIQPILSQTPSGPFANSIKKVWFAPSTTNIGSWISHEIIAQWNSSSRFVGAES